MSLLHLTMEIQLTMYSKTKCQTGCHVKSVCACLAASLMSRIERKYCLISTLYLARLFDIFILLLI